MNLILKTTNDYYDADEPIWKEFTINATKNINILDMLLIKFMENGAQ